MFTMGSFHHVDMIVYTFKKDSAIFTDWQLAACPLDFFPHFPQPYVAST